MTLEPLRVRGLREFQAALKAVDGQAQKELRLVLNEAAEIVVKTARRSMPSRSGRARASLKAASQQREARVQGGGKKAPYFGWLDFGGRVGRKKSARRTFMPGGRYVYPAYHAQRDNIERLLEKRLVDLAERNGLEVD